MSNLPAPFPVASGEVRLRGALLEIDQSTGRAVRITRVDEPGLAQNSSPDHEPKTDIESLPTAGET
jgi:calcineurin-like phosphoesterase